MRRYESVVILDPDLPDDDVQAFTDRYGNLVKENGGEVIKIEDWGSRKLAYLVRKRNRGRYILFDYVGLPAVVSEIERRFKIADEVMKYVSVKLDDEVDLEAFKAESERKAAEAAAAKAAAEAKAAEEAAKAAEAKRAREAEAAEQAAEQAAAEAPAESVEEAAQELPAEPAEEVAPETAAEGAEEAAQEPPDQASAEAEDVTPARIVEAAPQGPAPEPRPEEENA